MSERDGRLAEIDARLAADYPPPLTRFQIQQDVYWLRARVRELEAVKAAMDKVMEILGSTIDTLSVDAERYRETQREVGWQG